MPLELYAFWRIYSNDQITPTTPIQDLWEFNDEFPLFRTQITQYEVRFLIHSPMTAMLIRNFLVSHFGDIYDYVSIVHPRGFRQVLMTDYQNHIGKGHTAMFLSKPGH